jgi:hypothetical protein
MEPRRNPRGAREYFSRPRWLSTARACRTQRGRHAGTRQARRLSISAASELRTDVTESAKLFRHIVIGWSVGKIDRVAIMSGLRRTNDALPLACS